MTDPAHLLPLLPAFLAGALAAMAFLSLLTGRALRDRAPGLAGLLVCGAVLGAWAFGWRTPAALLSLALGAPALVLGWALLARLAGFQRTAEAAQVAQLQLSAQQARELEALAAQRSTELSARLRDQEEARSAAERANQGLQRALDQLEQVAATDRLTGAWNRGRFEEAVQPELALARRRREPLSLIMFDLDHFKQVNDGFGHGAGDLVLAGTAQTVRQQLRVSDALVRWGGEEFLVMAPATRLEGAAGLAEKLRTAVAAVEYPGIGTVTMSLGVAEYAPGETLLAWLERADRALYLAKAQGRNRTALAPTPEGVGLESPTERSLLEVTWEPHYESGNGLIDAQHQRLFRLASALLTTLAEDRSLPEVSLRLETLLAHTAQHFHDEEGLLREAGYPDLTEHAAVHAALLDRARALQAEVQAGQLNLGSLITFLAMDLVKGHILSEDRNYFDQLQGGAGPEPA